MIVFKHGEDISKIQSCSDFQVAIGTLTRTTITSKDRIIAVFARPSCCIDLTWQQAVHVHIPG